jgi:hypothetical protein
MSVANGLSGGGVAAVAAAAAVGAVGAVVGLAVATGLDAATGGLVEMLALAAGFGFGFGLAIPKEVAAASVAAAAGGNAPIDFTFRMGDSGAFVNVL